MSAPREYVGEHAACYMALDEKAAGFRQSLAELRAAIDANAEVGRQVRLLLLPGIKRKTYRREELQAIVDAADASFVGRKEEDQ